ncbi:hypothetical protein ACLBKU_09805 [Erythrobacter sp. NE805]|uniref:hypothetical protein n=1 Tax=Erythrobacter sp. NE805 TaxID=3389875 RepID=UPI00396B0347
MLIDRVLTSVLLLSFGIACAPSSDATMCKGWSNSQYIDLARKQKKGMLSRSVKAEETNFASDEATVADDPTGYAAKVSFQGKDGRSLIALIDEDCYVGWTKS